MHSPFEILKKEPAGSFRRFERVSDLASANSNDIAAGRSSFWVDARSE
jgi:hypothetical protein